MGVSTAVCVFLLTTIVLSTLGERHSLYYIYTALNKDLDLPGIYEFTALGLLDDRQIDYYNSKEQKKIPKQSWMMEKMQEDYWERGTQSRKSKEQWFKVNVDILMKRMNHNNQDLHVLQWRHGCEVEESNGEVKFLRGISEYGYDGSDFLSFDNSDRVWVAPVQAAEPTKRKWDGVAILNQYTQGYLEKECVDWITKFLKFRKESEQKAAPLDVHVFAKPSVSDSSKLILTCLATGFYPKDATVIWRRSSSPLSEDLITSSAVRPNDDGTYQLRKSVEILGAEKDQYECYVTHRTLKEPVIKKLDGMMPAADERHSLYYIYTGLSKDLDLPGIYEFTALGLLCCQEIDYYNSKEQKKIPKQSWMMEKMQEDYWEKGTQSRKSKEQWFKVNVDILMQRMNHNSTDLHVLQWRYGCEIEESSGEVKFLRGISEFGYDGSDFLSFDIENRLWITSVPQAEPTKRKWDSVAILGQYTKGYLEKECVLLLTKFLEYRKESLQKAAPLDVQVFAKPSVSDSSKLTLTCLATGFYPKDATVIWRRSSSPLSEDLITSSAVRPNDDGTYQLRKSVEILGAEKDQYECYVTHRTLKEPVIKKLGGAPIHTDLPEELEMLPSF
ncbi:class I histocompatibility antigen, Gogo-C*0101/C*0102 alpha chain-like isoform X5 [Astyanax mexicanus]|uniref:class I histocompatibility antigen, Gogo-C*0101/C*0102 alpha chain-like isoform X5 n=1 Tax=Astyanax mexicanus TaxID=7994 RepID=UPI0020CAFA8A|nr:class I histocompatibility antigen, Gogo-C*0101/C*0102 alpha chain-like isoform X5 [Astyanax mexicanus]